MHWHSMLAFVTWPCLFRIGVMHSIDTISTLYDYSLPVASYFLMKGISLTELKCYVIKRGISSRMQMLGL